MVHFFNRFCDFRHSASLAMNISAHHIYDFCKKIEITIFGCSWIVRTKEWNNNFRQLFSLSHAIAINIFIVIILSFVDINFSTIEKIFQNHQ